MPTTEYNERTASQLPALELLQSLGYTYISPEDCILQRGSRYNVILKDILRGQLRKLNRQISNVLSKIWTSRLPTV